MIRMNSMASSHVSLRCLQCEGASYRFRLVAVYSNNDNLQGRSSDRFTLEQSTVPRRQQGPRGTVTIVELQPSDNGTMAIRWQVSIAKSRARSQVIVSATVSFTWYYQIHVYAIKEKCDGNARVLFKSVLVGVWTLNYSCFHYIGPHERSYDTLVFKCSFVHLCNRLWHALCKEVNRHLHVACCSSHNEHSIQLLTDVTVIFHPTY